MKPMKVWLIDPNDATRASALDVLSSAGMAVVECAPLCPPPAEHDSNRPAVVLISSEIATLTETCKTLREAPNGFDLPILVMTRSNDEAAIQRAFLAGATDFIHRPLRHLPERLRYLQRETERRLELRRAYDLRVAANRLAGIGIWAWDPAIDEVELSPEAAGILGRSNRPCRISWEAFLGEIHDEDRHRIRRVLSELTPSDAPVRVEHRLIGRTATTEVIVYQEAVASKDPRGKLWVTGTIQDISVRKLAEAHVIRLAYYDDLTGLPNRTFLSDSLTNIFKSLKPDEERLALIAVYVDNLDRIVDIFGHDAGDHLLRMVAERLDHVPAGADTLIPEETLSLDDTTGGGGNLLARVGRSRFMFVFRNLDASADGWQQVRRIQEVLAEPVEIAGHRIVPSASVGLALYPEHGREPATLLKNVEAAQHQAVASGSGQCVMFTEELYASARDRLTMEMALRRAIDSDGLEVYYQPKVSAASGQPVGMEALLRWTDPELGAVSPGRFIPIAEETGLIQKLGYWVLHTACTQLAEWRKSDLPVLRVAVNISPEQFIQPDFVQIVLHCLREAGVPGTALELEITESLLMRDTAVAVDHLTDLRRMGIHVALDDFGTGYSSLSYLHRFPLDTLKIDRSFVIDMMHKPDAATIVRAIILLSHSLNLRVVAEGVEQFDQLEELRKLGCDEIQGFYYSPALPALAFERWIRQASGELSAAVGQ